MPADRRSSTPTNVDARIVGSHPGGWVCRVTWNHGAGRHDYYQIQGRQTSGDTAWQATQTAAGTATSHQFIIEGFEAGTQVRIRTISSDPNYDDHTTGWSSYVNVTPY